MITQFVSAFDDCFVYRYTKDGVKKEKIGVRYIVGPKQRILHDIVNLNKNITLPAVAIEQTGIRRDPDRIQNKDQHFFRTHLSDDNISKVPQPIPVQMDLDVSIIARYKEDLDQIISNFVPWANPYFIIAWKVPDEFDIDFSDEIRSEVSWSGDVSFENPINISKDDKYRIVGNTSFTIKGWMFPPADPPNVAPIYVVNTEFNAISSGAILNYNSYNSLSSVNYYDTETMTISAYPEFTNSFINGNPYFSSLSVNSQNDNLFTFYGKRFNFDNDWYLSANQVIPDFTFEEIHTAKGPTISGYKVPDHILTTVNDNIATINLSSEFLSAAEFTFVTANSAGWASNDYNIVVI
jgi:hypothetical protein